MSEGTFMYTGKGVTVRAKNGLKKKNDVKKFSIKYELVFTLANEL